MAKYLRSLTMVASATVLAALASGVQAATLVTPPAVLPNNASVFCMLVNAGTAPIQATNAVHNAVGADISAGNTCPTPPATLDPGATCWTMFTTGGQTPVYCRFTSSSSKVRGSLVVRDANGAFGTTVPATK
jgi:hypothetical protein